jgi:hypothetical protein
MFLKRCRLIVLGLLIFAGCSIPFFDRAEVEPGPALSGGISINTGYATSGYSEVSPLPIDFGYRDYYADLAGTLRLYYGLSEYVGIVLQGSVGNGIWLTGPEDPKYSPLIYDIQVGAKCRTGRKSALQTTLSFPGIFDFWYLYDFNQFLTGTAGIGLRGISFGLTGTFPLQRNLRLHIGVNLTSGDMWNMPEHLPAASLGIGLGYKPGR